MFKALIVTIAAFASTFATAAERRYWASLSQSQWQVSESRVKCELLHEIPGYGRALISQLAGEELKLTLVSDLDLNDTSYSIFGDQPPNWKHTGRYVQIGRANVAAGPVPLELNRADTLRVMAALDSGNLPEFNYRDPLGGANQIQIQLNVAHYRAAADQFRKCLGGLVDLGYEKLRTTELYFQFDRDHLTRTSRQRLDKLADLLNADPGISKVLISAHADARGSQKYNLRLSERRAKAVANYLAQKGVNKGLLEMRFFGEDDPRMTNRTSTGRTANRRVIIELVKPPALRQARAR